MKKLICALLALILSFSVTAALAVNLDGTVEDYLLTDYFRMATMTAIRAKGEVKYEASVDGSDWVPVKQEMLNRSNIGHIIVLDASTYYMEKYKRITSEMVRAIAQAYLNTVDVNEQVMFLIAKSDSVYQTEYMTLEAAKNYLLNVELDIAASSQVYEAINAAFRMATGYNGANGEPFFKSVFVVVDPATDLNAGNSSLLQSATVLHNDFRNQGRDFQFYIATIFQESIMKSDAARRGPCEKGLDEYENFAANNGTYLIRINHKMSEDLDASQVINSVKLERDLHNYYLLDFGAIHPLIDYAQKEHVVTLAVRGGSTDVSLALGYVNEALPTPIPTATPEATASPDVPTFTPVPTPVVQQGDSHTWAKSAIYNLQKLGYLADRPKEFDEACCYALMDFCEVNQVEKRDNMDEELYELLCSDAALPKPTPVPEATPTPTATPVPTPEPTKEPLVYVGANHTNAMRVIRKLHDLYYLNGELKDYKEFDHVCVQAFMDFCEDNDLEQKNWVDELAWQVLIESPSVQPKVTPTPEPVVTPEPEATIPPEGYGLMQADGANSTFIAQMQTVLEEKNFFDDARSVGIFDQATLDAVTRYCEAFQVINTRPDGVDSQVVNDILQIGPKRAAYVPPEPSLSENFREFLQREVLMLGTFSVRMWMLLTLVVVLLFIIMLIIMLMGASKKKKNHVYSAALPAPNADKQAHAAAPAVSSTSVPVSMGGDSDVTIPSGRASASVDSDVTMPRSAGFNVTLHVEGGQNAGMKRAMLTSANYVLGRSADCDLQLSGDALVSRKHAALTCKDGRPSIYDLDSVNGTIVNGQKLAKAATSVGESEMTLPMNAGRGGGTQVGGQCLNRGDVIEIGGYKITINW